MGLISEMKNVFYLEKQIKLNYKSQFSDIQSLYNTCSCKNKTSQSGCGL